MLHHDFLHKWPPWVIFDSKDRNIGLFFLGKGFLIVLQLTDGFSFTLVFQQGELMKMKGNEEFSKERFDLAILYYSRAIEYR